MARSTRKPAAETVTDESVSPAIPPTAILLIDCLTVKRATNHSDLKLKEAVHTALTRICDLTSGFIAEKEAEGFTLAEILELYEVVGPVAPTVEEVDGRVKVNWDVQIVEKSSDE